jgi:ABC-2 type transport system ATP-binding protein
LGISEKHKAGKLSGGQQAQLALSLALARHPQLLVLDEPTAPLDPLARHDFMATVMTAMADDGVSVVLSSHVLTELERVADHLVLLSHGRVRVDGPIDDLLACHRLITSPTSQPARGDGWEVIESTPAGAQTHQIVRLALPIMPMPPAWESRPVGIEELALAYLRETSAPAVPTMAGAPR